MRPFDFLVRERKLGELLSVAPSSSRLAVEGLLSSHWGSPCLNMAPNLGSPVLFLSKYKAELKYTRC